MVVTLHFKSSRPSLLAVRSAGRHLQRTVRQMVIYFQLFRLFCLHFYCVCLACASFHSFVGRSYQISALVCCHAIITCPTPSQFWVRAGGGGVDHTRATQLKLLFLYNVLWRDGVIKSWMRSLKCLPLKLTTTDFKTSHKTPSAWNHCQYLQLACMGGPENLP